MAWTLVKLLLPVLATRTVYGIAKVSGPVWTGVPALLVTATSLLEKLIGVGVPALLSPLAVVGKVLPSTLVSVTTFAPAGGVVGLL